MAHVLICDDDELLSRAMVRTLRSAGHTCTTAASAEAALTQLSRQERTIEILLADLHMPGMDGVELLERVALLHPQVMRLLISGGADYASACAALNRGGAFRMLSKPVVTADFLRSISEAAQHREQNLELAETLRKRTLAALDGLVLALDLRDADTGWHSRRVSLYARRLGEEVGLRGLELADCERGALLHDLGKMGVRDEVLLKCGPLDDQEWREMQAHSALGHALLGAMSFLGGAAEVVHAHHERWDGTGYPRQQLAGEIVIGARVFAVVDTLDAITSDCPHRKARPYEMARQEIERCAGSQFDPGVVAAFLRIAPEEWALLRQQVKSGALALQLFDEGGAV